jgi:hypothetical protein
MPAEAEELGMVDVVGDAGEELTVGRILEDLGGDEPVGVGAVGVPDPSGFDEDGVVAGRCLSLLLEIAFFFFFSHL